MLDCEENLSCGILYQNQSNPAHSFTTIAYSINESNEVSLVLYDVSGRIVKYLVNTHQEAGNYQVNVSVDDLQDGLYFYQLQTDEGIQTKRMLVLK